MVPFIKASACGNDFLIIEGEHAPPDLAEFSRAICDRHNGVGADGVEWIFPPQANEGVNIDIHARLINADGSEAEISGNGTRCVAACLVSQGAARKLTIQTGAGLRRCELISRDRNVFEFEMEMGVPKAGESFAVKTSWGEIHGMPVSTGNPHFVVFTSEFPDHWRELGREIGSQKIFTEGVNVEFVKVEDRSNLQVRFYERGAGETESSGTGSCASAVAALASGAACSPLHVHAPGGTQVVRWHGDQVFLRGPATIVCRGAYLL